MYFYRKYFPLVASAYSAAMFIYFTFMSNNKFDAFTYGNMVLMSFWAAYCWIVIYNQDIVIDNLTKTMASVAASLKLLAEMEEQEVDEEEEEEKKT